jgi:tetratricopeptide (TPR) repeat protein
MKLFFNNLCILFRRGGLKANILCNKGAILNHQGLYNKAVLVLNSALEIVPRFATAWNNKSYSLAHLKRYKEAIYCCDKALEIAPRFAKALNNKAHCLASLGRYKEAIYCSDKALEINPRNKAARNNKGNSLRSLGRHKEAISCFDKALEIDPRCVSHHEKSEWPKCFLCGGSGIEQQPLFPIGGYSSVPCKACGGNGRSQSKAYTCPRCRAERVIFVVGEESCCDTCGYPGSDRRS